MILFIVYSMCVNTDLQEQENIVDVLETEI